MDARNDLKAAVPKLCLALEAARRTDEAVRVRTSHEFLAFFFPFDEKNAIDKLFVHLPASVRGPILSSWGIRGKKAALTDNDAKVLSVVHDALIAGDIDHAAVEQAITPELLVKHLPLADVWSFWRGGKLTKKAVLLAFTTAAEVGEIDASWLFANLKTGELTGTDALASFLSREDLTRWVRAIHQTGDGSAQGIFGALGWSFFVDKVDEPTLLAALDALAAKMGLASAAPQTERHMPPLENKSEPLSPSGAPARPVAPPLAKDSGREITRKPEPAKPPEPSLRRSQRPPMIPIDIEEPSEGTDEYPLAEADALKRLTKT